MNQHLFNQKILVKKHDGVIGFSLYVNKNHIIYKKLNLIKKSTYIFCNIKYYSHKPMMRRNNRYENPILVYSYDIQTNF